MTSVSFDLDPSGKLCDGRLSWQGGELVGYIDGREAFRQPLNEAAELVQFGDVGCGRLELKRQDRGPEDNIALCRFSMSCVNEIGELCKVVNHYLQTGAETEIKKEALRRCEQCNRSLLPGLSFCMFCADKKGIWLRAIKGYAPLRPAIVKATVHMLVFDISRVAIPLLQGWLIDAVLSPGSGNGSAWMQVPPGWSPAQAIWAAGAAMALLYIIGQFFLSLSLVVINRTSVKYSDHLRRTTYDKIQKLSLSSMSRRRPGDLMKRVTTDTQTVREFIDGFGRATFEKSILIVLISMILFVLHPGLAALTVATVPATLFIYRKFWGRLGQKFDRMWRASSRERSLLHDIIKGIRVVKTFGTEQREIEKFAKTSERLRDAAHRVELFWALLSPFTRLAIHAGEIIVMAVGGRMVLHGTMSVGRLVAFTLLLSFLNEPLRWMSFLPRRLAEATNSLLKVYEVLDEDHSMSVPENPVKAPVEGPLKFEDLRFGYVPYEPVLKNINLELKPGEMLGLVGSSGAGKSTLINLAMRMYDPDNGRVTANGLDLRDFDPTWLHQNIGVVFQETFLFAGTVYDNIAYGGTKPEPEEIIRAAKIANAHDFIMKLPDGYHTLVGEDGHTLSGGEKQRVAIARAVLRDPKILILDEATSALDPETEGILQEALERLVKGRITIAIAHRLSTLRHADRIAVIDNGGIAELGTHRELLTQKGIYYNLVTTQRQMSRETDAKSEEED